MIRVFDFFTEDECDALDECYDKAKWHVGKMIFHAGMSSKEKKCDTKSNFEIPVKSASYAKCLNIFRGAIHRNGWFTKFTGLLSHTGPKFLRYREGGEYKYHHDSTWMDRLIYKSDGPTEVRTCYSDYSCTIFIGNPDDYDGGELNLDVSLDKSYSIPIKLKRGQLILYDTGIPHWVDKVTSGNRDVVVFWIQSTFQDPRVRHFNEKMVTFSQEMYDKLERNSDSFDTFHDGIQGLDYELKRNFSTRAQYRDGIQ